MTRTDDARLDGEGTIVAVPPRIRLARSFDPRSSHVWGLMERRSGVHNRAFVGYAYRCVDPPAVAHEES